MGFILGRLSIMSFQLAHINAFGTQTWCPNATWQAHHPNRVVVIILNPMLSRPGCKGQFATLRSRRRRKIALMNVSALLTFSPNTPLLVAILGARTDSLGFLPSSLSLA